MNTKHLLTICFLCLVALGAQANDEKYLQAMQANIKLVYEADSVNEFQVAVNSFARIAEVENARWEPRYYAAFGYLMMSTRVEGPERDTYLDYAEDQIQKALVLAAEESELHALQGFVHMMRVTVDPGGRGAKFGSMAVSSYNKALAINPDNPRALILLAQMEYGTAKFFGSSTSDACETGLRALEKFASVQSTSALAPVWGKKMAENFQAECQ